MISGIDILNIVESEKFIKATTSVTYNSEKKSSSSSRIGYFLALLLFTLLTSCGEDPSFPKQFSQQQISKGEYIYRRQDEYLFRPPPPTPQPLPIYEWKKELSGKIPAVTKHHFRCHGKGNNPFKQIEQNGETRYVSDCNGPSDHSLPIKDGQEFVYPILIDLLNYIQLKTENKVIITSGHRCPDHHIYVDNSPAQSYSKHMIGAEVDFYVQGLEDKPEYIIDLIQKYYLDTLVYNGQKDYQQFLRWEKGNSDVITSPWYNKEIYVKIYRKNEGRNLDNLHTHPYVSIQVRYNKDNGEKVTYSWDKAFRGFYRH